MILKKLSLSNFRSFQHAVLEFDDAQNYIFGGNWQGKSSIVDAIGFAFFGAEVFPRKMAGASIKAEHLLNERASRGAVELTFTAGDKEYVLHRSIPPKVVTLSSDRKRIASGTRNVGEQLRDRFGIDAKLFQNVFYADQDELRKSLEFSPEQRRLFIERLLGLEVWADRADGIRRTYKQLEEFHDELVSGKLGVLLSDLDALSSQISEDKEELKDLNESIAEAKKNLPRNISTLRQQEKSVADDINAQTVETTKVEHEIQHIHELVESLARGNCPTCTQPVPPKLKRSRLATLKASLKELKSGLRAATRELENLQEAYDSVDYEDAFERSGDLKELRGQQKQLEKSLRQSVERERKLRAQAKIFGKKPQQVEKTKAELAFLQRLENVIHEYRRELRGRVVQQLEQAMNEFLTRFHDGDHDVFVILDADLAVTTRLHGREVPIFNLSGAAKDILALALRYGLLRIAARHIDFIVLDEPTRHMDAANSRRLKDAFDDLAGHQLIVVTVHQEFTMARGRHFTIRKDDRLFSTVTIDTG
jgi:DNA repair protein SbcC/Rad50